MDPDLERRSRAAARYRPSHIALLLVAEAPPSASDRYFYFGAVRDQDSLFRYVLRAVLGVDPCRAEKPAQLELLRAAGVYLIDLNPTAKAPGEDLEPYVEDLVERAVALKPDRVMTIKTNVCDLCQAPLRAAGLNVARARVPFPGSGQQRRFEEQAATALRELHWTPPTSS